MTVYLPAYPMSSNADALQLLSQHNQIQETAPAGSGVFACNEDLLSFKTPGFQSIDKLHAADLACMIASNDLSNACI